MVLTLALIGSGAIGSRVAELLDAGAAPGVRLAGVVPMAMPAPASALKKPWT